MAQLKAFFDQDIEPAPTCHNCEYYDGGGLRPNGQPVNDAGDCLNRQSPRLQTTINDTCGKFFPCSTRWPGADHE